MPTIGRGGAGNIQAAEQIIQTRSNDLEANHQAVESFARSGLSTEPARGEQQFAHSGRGGAGNYYSPKELSTQGHFSSSDSRVVQQNGSIESGAGGVTGAAYAAPTRVGRGGAGNIGFGADDAKSRAEQQLREQEAMQKQLHERIEKGVNETLAMPQKARLHGTEPA